MVEEEDRGQRQESFKRLRKERMSRKNVKVEEVICIQMLTKSDCVSVAGGLYYDDQSWRNVG